MGVDGVKCDELQPFYLFYEIPAKMKGGGDKEEGGKGGTKDGAAEERGEGGGGIT